MAGELVAAAAADVGGAEREAVGMTKAGEEPPVAAAAAVVGVAFAVGAWKRNVSTPSCFAMIGVATGRAAAAAPAASSGLANRTDERACSVRVTR